jgi:poly-gamma-glutamate synthesis protein (capsule biosynthesis protein)
MKSHINLVAVGDILINGVVADLVNLKGSIAPFALALDAISDVDIKFGNLECPLSTRGMPLEKCCLHSVPEAAESLSSVGFNIISLANNHTFDYGCEAFEDTCSMLDENKVLWFGAGHNIKEATKPAIMEINGLRVGFLGYSWNFIGSIDATSKTPGCAPLKKKLIVKDVMNLKHQVDTVVVSLHWGYERERYPLPYQRKMVHDIIDAGASLILGHHPHVLQGIEEYKNGVIVYSLGNFIFPDFRYMHFHLLQKEENRESIIFRCVLSKKAVEQLKFYRFGLRGIRRICQ